MLVKMKLKAKIAKRFAPTVLACTLTVGLFSTVYSSPAVVQAAGEPNFKIQSGGVYDGMPLFDGNPENLDAFVDRYFEYVGLEGAALYATGIRDNYTFVMDDNPNKGKTVPGGIAAADNPYGVSTDFASLLALGQTWNKDLVTRVGQVMGSEKISQLNVKQGTANIHNGSNASKPIAFTSITDVRVNPLNGRFAEGYSEDPYLTATMVDNMSAGLAGTNLDESDDGFWQRAIVGTRHYSLYNAEWFRQSASYNASARAIYEYHLPSAYKAFESGSLSGVMTSFGRANGIPNIISPYLILGDKKARFGMYSSPDFNAENHVFSANTSNGYDTKYTLDRKHTLALMVLAHSESTRASGTDKTDVVTLATAVKEGLYGITLKNVQDAGRPLINQLVRIGVFNEVDANGVPIKYPFANQAKDVSTSLTSYMTAAHQEVALQEARETVVLLKNVDGALPLSKAEKAAVGGLYADTRIVAQNGLSTPNIENASKSPLYTLLKTLGADKVKYAAGNEVIALKSVLNDKYVTAGSGAGSQLSANYTASGNQFSNAQLFEVADWGQQATSLQAKVNNLWITAPTSNSASVGNTQNSTLYLTNPDWATLSANARTSTIPPKLRIESNADATVSIVANGLAAQTGIFNGRFLTTGSDDRVTTASAAIGNIANFNARNNAVKFEKTTVVQPGAEIASMANTQDYALVFIGADPRNSAGEGSDRADLYMGANDYKLVKNVSAAFAAQGKKTIVVILSNSPVIADEIQKDPNVSAIVNQPYAGQYDSQGLVDVLFGDYAPTGRLTSTWYADMDALPAIDKYSIPEGNTAITSLEQLDPRYVTDMFNSDPEEAKLTYMYTDADVTYPFGYGLGYAEFTYKNFVAPPSANKNNKFTVAVEITNEGDLTTSEVIQLYAKKNDSAYGSSSAKRKLVSYEKVELTAGEGRVVTLTVDPKDLAIWDVNKGDYIVEDGSYTFMVGHSSADIRHTQVVSVSGDSVATVKAMNGFNVFDHSFAANQIYYREASKERTVAGLKAEKIAGEYYVTVSKQQGSWVAIPKADFAGAKKLVAQVASNGSGGSITLRAGSPSNEPFATIPVPVTNPVSYTMPNTNLIVNELGYTAVEVDVTQAPVGSQTVYVVFDAPDLRIDRIKVTEFDIAKSATLSGPEKVNAGGLVELAYGLNGIEQQTIIAQDITIAYDAQKLDFVDLTSFDDEQFLIAAKEVDEANGTVRFLAVHFQDARNNPNREWAELKLRSKLNAAAGITAIQITDAQIADEHGIETTIDGYTFNLQLDTVDRSVLEALIASALAAHDAAVEGNRVGQYLVGSKRILESAIHAAQAVFMNPDATEEALQQAYTALNTALQTFNAAKIVEVTGDANNDDKLSVGDLAVVANHYGATSGDQSGNWNLVKKYDFNHDGKIDVEDLVWLAKQILNW